MTVPATIVFLIVLPITFISCFSTLALHRFKMICWHVFVFLLCHVAVRVRHDILLACISQPFRACPYIPRHVLASSDDHAISAFD